MRMDSACGNAALPALGFPIRESTDHRLFSAYPWLIAAVHALHRLLVPRHPPCALHILTVITRSTRRRARGDTRYIGKNCTVFKDRARASAGLAAGLSKLNSMRGSRPKARAQRHPADSAGGHEQVRSTLLGPGRSSGRVAQLEGDPGAPILETSL